MNLVIRCNKTVALLGALTFLCCSSAARAAAPAPPPDQIAEVGTALGRGAFSEAVDRLELWSDQGIVHPDLSFNRGVAYLGRAESPAQQRGDLGQAAAAFQEALYLHPDDEEAEVVLERVRELISERRAKREDAGVVARPRLVRALIGLVDENLWAGLAIVGSALLTAGLAARLWSRMPQVRLAASIAAAAGGFLLALGAAMAAGGAHLRARYSPAVVIVEEARLVDAAGRPVATSRSLSSAESAADRIPEGSLVHVAEHRGGLARVEWGDADVWVNARELRRIAQR